MTQRRALILFFAGILLLQVALFSFLASVDAGSEAKVLAYLFVVCVGGLGVGGVMTRFPR